MPWKNHRRSRDPSPLATGEQLVASELRFGILFDAAAEGILIADLETHRFIAANPAIGSMLGYGEDELLDMRIEDIHPKASLESVLLQFQEQARGERLLAPAIPCQRKDGSTLYADIASKMAVIEGRACLIGFFTDISERVLADEALRSSEEKYRHLVERAEDGIIIIQDGILKYANPGIARMWGGSSSEILDTPFSNYIHPGDLNRVVDRYRQRLAGEPIPSIYEARLQRKDGGTVCAELNSGVIAHDGSPAVLVIVRDITERKMAERALQTSLDEWRSTFDATEDAICLLDVEQKITRCNRAMMSRFHKDPDELIGHHCWEIVHGTSEPISGCPFVRMRQTLQRQSMELLDKGTWLEVTVDPIFGESGELNGTVHVLRDISAHKQVEGDLRTSKQLLELFFQQSLDGFFFMMLDEPVTWDETVDKDEVLDYVFSHQRVTRANDAMLLQYGATREEYLGQTPSTFFAHDIEYGKQVWRDFFDAGQLHIETDERKLDGTQMWIEGDYVCLYDEQRHITGHFGIQREVTERKRLVGKLEESEKQYRELVQSTPCLICKLSPDGTTLFVNRYVEEVTGYNSPELIGRNWWETFYPAPESAHKVDDLLEAFKRGDVRDYEMILIAGDGRRHLLSWNSFNVWDKNGELIEINGVGIDLTERHALAKQLQTSEEKYRTIVETTHEGVWMIDADANTTYVNPRMAQILGYSPNEMMGRHLFTFMDEEAVAAAKTNLERRKQGTSEQHEFRFQRKDGGSIWTLLETTPILGSDGHYVGALAMVTDITPRHQAMAQLEKSEARYRDLFDNANDIIYTHDLNGRITSLNKKAELLLGVAETEVLGTDIFALATPQSRERSRQMFANKMDGGLGTTYEVDLLAKDGAELPVEISSHVIYENGKPVGIQGIARDITDRKRIEAERLAALAHRQQSQKLESIGTLASGVAHEINNPLMGVIGYAELIGTTIDDPKVKEYSAEIVKEGNRIATIVRNLLTFSRQDKEMHSLVEINDIVDAALSLLRAVLRKDQITLDVDIAKDLPQVKCRSQQIQQVMINLLTNARDALNKRYPEYDENKIIRITACPLEKDGTG